MAKLFFTVVLFTLGSIFPDPKFELIRSLPIASSFIATDNLENVYLMNGNVLEKYDGQGTLLKNYSNKAFGNISSVDATNPLRVLLFFKSFQQIAFLDNMLAPAGNMISLDALGHPQTDLACSSHDNGLWIYSLHNSELVRFDQDLQKAQQTGNIAQLTGKKIQPDFLIEQNNRVFLNDSSNGILVFDIYGTYNKTIPIKGINRFQILNDKIIYYTDGKLKSFDLKTMAESETALPAGDIIDARTEKEKLYLLKQKSLDIYHVKDEK